MESQVIKMAVKTLGLVNNKDLRFDIEIDNLTKIYKLKKKNQSLYALNNINLNVKKGEILGLLGPNGAGKTTLVSILSTLNQPTSGTVKILGYDVVKQPWNVKMNIGLMFGSEMIYHRLTGYQNLKFFSKLYGISNYKERIKDLAEIFNLTKWMDQYVDKYSKGMQLKLALSRILLINPRVLLLDEPLLGLDPKSVADLIGILKNLKQTIILTSHQMNIVEKLCNRIAFLKEGKIIKIDTQHNFKKYLFKSKKYKIKIPEKKDALIKKLKDEEYIIDIEQKKDHIILSIQEESSLNTLFNILKDFPIKGFTEIEPELDEIFLKLS